MKHNSISEDIPIVIILKAAGIVSDLEILQLVCGSDSNYQDLFVVNFEEAARLEVFTQQQALYYVGKRVKTIRRAGAPKLSQLQEGIEAIATTIIAHLTVSDLQFREKLFISPPWPEEWSWPCTTQRWLMIGIMSGIKDWN